MYQLNKLESEDRKTIIDGINKYNFEQLTNLTSKETIILDYSFQNKEGEVLAGILSYLGYFGAWEIRVLWVDKDYRTKDIGSTLLREVEKIAIQKGAEHAIVDTFDFQAKDFYLKSGFKVFGQIDNHPKGHTRYYMKKTF